MPTNTDDWTVRLRVTDAERRALKVLAVERDQEIADLLTEAVRQSPVTRGVFA